MSGQSAFRAAVLNPGCPPPDGLHDGRDAPAGRRFDVYRNNVTQSLIEAMRSAFPLVRKLIGAQRFDAVAVQYVRAHPPTSPLMMHYGAEFPVFLQGCEPLSQIGYLGDAARLDLALRASYHAADAPAFDAAAMAQIAPEDLPTLQLRPAPATRILRSRWPLHDIWRMNFEPGAPKPRAVAQDILVTRPGFDPAPHALPPGAADWLDQLASGLGFADALDATMAACPDFDFTASLTLALATAALTVPTRRRPT
jgi:hypothetical protein